MAAVQIHGALEAVARAHNRHGILPHPHDEPLCHNLLALSITLSMIITNKLKLHRMQQCYLEEDETVEVCGRTLGILGHAVAVVHLITGLGGLLL